MTVSTRLAEAGKLQAASPRPPLGHLAVATIYIFLVYFLTRRVFPTSS